MNCTIVNILLSTYNGEKYITQQLDSILAQKNVQVRLYIRDDGSSDRTISILKEYKKKFTNVYLYLEKNIGCIDSFFRLIDYVNRDERRGKYYAFCDQDDVWDDDKLYAAISALDAMADLNIPALYCSNLEIVDSELHFKGLMYKGSVKPLKGRSLVHNICTGCTMVMNQRLVDEHLSIPRLKEFVMHDWYFYNLAVYTGKVIFDPIPHIKYRQHDANVIGANTKSLISKGKNLIWGLKKAENEHYRGSQAYALHAMFSGLINDKDLKNIKLVATYRKSLKSKIKLLFNEDICQKDINLRIRILLNLI